MQPIVFHDPARPEDRSPLGAVTAGAGITVRLRCPEGQTPLTAVSLTLGGQESPKYEMTWQDQAWQVSFIAPQTVGAYGYTFLLRGEEGEWIYAPDDQARSGLGRLYAPGEETPVFRLTVYDPAFTAPETSPVRPPSAAETSASPARYR